MRFTWVVLLALAGGSALAQPSDEGARASETTGRVSGRVVDGAGKPIAGAQITVDEHPELRTTTAADGTYAIDHVPAGASLVVSKDGYEAGIAVATGKVVDDVVLVPLAKAEVIEVKGDGPPQAAGAAKLEREEVRRLPGAGNDLIRSLGAMPGVVDSMLPTSQNGVVIRGAAPEDSKLLVDGFEVPSLYHEIGFRSIIPTEAIDSLDYIPGGFGVEYGRAASGIVSLQTRPGETTSEQAELSGLDGGALAQGKTGDLRYMIAFRRSTIDLLLPLVLPPNLDLSLTTVPRYYDEQLRLDYALTPKWRLTFSSIGSDDLLELYTDRAENADKRFYNRSRFVRFIAGARYSDGPWNGNVALSVMPLQYDIASGQYQHIDITQVAVDSRAELQRTWHGTLGLTDLTWRLGAQTNFSHYDLAIDMPPQPREGSTTGDAFPDPMDTRNHFRGTAFTPDAGAWTGLTAGLSSDIRATAGVRADLFGRTGDLALQPRGELQIKLPAKLTARFAAGAYRRAPENQEELEHTDLHPERATQLVAGLEHAPRAGLRFQGSLYYTDRSHLIMREDGGTLSNTGRGTTMGVELLATYRDGPWFGWLSGSLSHSVRQDSPTATERLFEYDQPISLNAALSWRSKHWQLGARFQLYSGLPYTPVIGAIYDSDRNYYDPVFGKIYSERAPLHHQLDLRVDRFFKLGPLQMNWFLDIQNVYMNESTMGYFYSYDYMQRSAFRSLPILPTAGLRGVL